MNLTNSDRRSMLEQLQGAASGTDVVKILGDVSAVKELSAHAKETGVRKAVMLLASPDPALDIQARLKRLAFLAALATVKPVRSIVEEFAPRALAEPPTAIASGLSQQEKAVLAAWISARKIGWIADFAARTAIAESKDERLCQTYLALFFSRAPDISHVIRQLTDVLSSLGMPPGPAGALGKLNLCSALARLVAKASVPAGKQLPYLLRNFMMEEILKGREGYQPAERTGIALSVSALLSVLVQRFQGLLLSDTPFEIVSSLEKEWISPADRKWKAWRKQLFARVEEVTTLFALNGVCATDLVRKVRMFETPPGSAEKMCQSILEQNNILSDEVAGWLALGGTLDGPAKARLRDTSSDTEALAQVLLLADELTSLDPRQGPEREQALQETLIGEINQFAARKGMKLDSERNSIMAYDPIRQRATRAPPFGGRVRVLSPGVVRKSDTGLFQVIQVIVEPIDP